ncbi:TIGR03089 family protein [Pseudonocardia sp. MH-G8]|uniref:TIGR03089 family protein n=1 Tax=Pseudonocardia sp. MH-G8 TaxID=1854588 RepID=UPI000BA153DA|nr:TIGR03089 family protein [Pseudonocardia sp. MH-G8]OZM77587.1 TIGR03089 family protein [Pseudonocardia sp. MH-G8]
MTLTAALLGPLRSGAAAARPLITFYDDATGERVELSATTAANWAAKAANLLREECDVEPGTPVAVLLPAHWQTAAVLLAAWWCGAVVTEPAEAEWVLCDADRVDLALGAEPAGGVVALSLDAFGAGVPGLPAGVVDFATEVRLQGDEFVPWSPVPDDAPALAGATVGEVLAAARARAGALGISRGDRVLSTLDWSTVDGLRDGLLAVLAAEASLVQVRHPDEEAMARRAATERTTVRLG